MNSIQSPRSIPGALLKSGLVLLFLFPLLLSAQEKKAADDDLHLELEMGGFVSTGKTLPFWARTNQFGEVPLESGIGTLRASIYKDYAKRDGKRWNPRYGFGVRGVANGGNRNQLLLPEAYAKVKFGPFEIYGGRRREIMGLADSTLGSGSYIWSGNALPMPKVQISIPEYTPLLKSGLISIKGNYAHGWFGTDQHTKNYWLHQKSFYARLGKPEWRLKFHGGFNHQVQWGGAPVTPYTDPETGMLVTSYEKDFAAYINTVLGISLSDQEAPAMGDDGVLIENTNRGGNHLGSLDIAFEYDDPYTNILLYRQSIYEDGSLFYLSNISDGLTGISFTRKNAEQGIIKVVAEYLYTVNQGGEQGAGFTIPELRGQDAYFYNAIYQDGWTYKGNTIGTPFIMPLSRLTAINPNIYPEKWRFPNAINNNRIKLWMLGIESRIKRLDLTTRISYSENLGAFLLALSANQLSIQQSVALPVGAFRVRGSLFYDQGELLEKNIGLGLSVSRKF